MSNFYTENRKFYCRWFDLEEVVRHLESNFESHDADTLHSYQEAQRWYEMILDNAGAICADFIAPRAEAVDHQGASFDHGVVRWAPETVENMKVLSQGGYMGGTLPRSYGGLNLPGFIHNIIVEMVSQADASLMNLFGLQDIAVTLLKFGTEEQKDRILPRFARGEISGAMALTEPEAGSDLQAVELKAIEKEGQWYLNGVKRFITNGCGNVSLVLARSESGSKGAKGLSMFLYERDRDDNLVIRRIEEKLGIHGSPTCELQFNNARAELVGKRKFGLIKYVMSLMNGARLSVSYQALGIAQAAWNEAVKYAHEREQFGEKIVKFPAVYQMLSKMQAQIETTRVLLYHTSWVIDRMEMLEKQENEGMDVKKSLREVSNLANFLTPLSKFTASEMANQAAYDSMQIHGGCGFMKDFPVERLYRDARITNIYEGTTQLQVVAAIGSITAHLLDAEWQKLKELKLNELIQEQQRIIDFTDRFNQVIDRIKTVNDKEWSEYTANYLVESASILYRMALYLPIADAHPVKRELFGFFMAESEARIDYLFRLIAIMEEKYGASISRLKTDLHILS
ncbi:MAG: acyl-CoA dehydrogenase family protein [Candidatus Delongbacteria bacterium]|nr:acyl-CoA dehydrogenase family protein [Candidatus Delongbacteria bacterium]